MTNPLDTPNVVADGTSDVLAVDDVVQVPLAAVELVHSLRHRQDSNFVAEIPDWDLPDWEYPSSLAA